MSNSLSANDSEQDVEKDGGKSVVITINNNNELSSPTIERRNQKRPNLPLQGTYTQPPKLSVCTKVTGALTIGSLMVCIAVCNEMGIL